MGLDRGRTMKKLACLVLLVGWIGLGQTVVDQTGREVVLPAKVERVVCLQGGTTWIVYALGAGDRLVGAYFVSLPRISLAQQALAGLDPLYAAKELPIKPTLEALLALQPDVVLASAVVHGEALARQLADVGIPTVLYYPETLDTLYEAILLTGQVLGRAERAMQLARRLTELVEHVRVRMQGVAERPRVYFAAYTMFNVYAGDVIQNVLIELAGGQPLGRALSPRPGLFWQRVDAEQLLVWDPEVILVPSYSRASPNDFLNDPVLATVSAVRQGRVYRFPEFFGPWDVPSPEVGLGLLWLAETLHPGSTGLDLAAEVARFYEEFFECRLTLDEIAAWLGR